MEQFDDESLEKSFYGYLVCLHRDGIDRRTQSTVPCDPRTGLPLNESDVLPIGLARFGDDLIFEFRIEAHAFAVAFAGLTYRPQHLWTKEEAVWVSRTTIRLKQLIRRGAEHGYICERPVDLFHTDGRDLAMAADGFATEAVLTPSGLRHARELVAGTKYEAHRPSSILAGAPIDVVSEAPDWAKRSFKEEAS